MRSRTQKGPHGYLWEWLEPGIWRWWRVRRVTSRYILLTPTEDNKLLWFGDPYRDHMRVYCLIRWPEPEEAKEDGEYVP